MVLASCWLRAGMTENVRRTLVSLKDRYPGVPLAAYNVSGEFSMIKAAAAAGMLDEREAALESLTAMRRAGAGIILTYWAKQVARWLNS